MLLSGFTFVRNAVKYDYPIRECIESMLPIVDELVINLGNSDDGTDALIENIKSPKIKIIRSVWDDTITDRGLILSQQTNIALDACQGRWCLYLQADEVLHEMEHMRILRAVSEADAVHSITKAGATVPGSIKRGKVDALKFRYLHFYGGYTLVQRPWNWYPDEIRIVRRESGARSFGDAQTFRGPNGEMLSSELLDAHVFHYGHAREPEQMAQKIHYFHRFWHGDEHKIKVDKAYAIDLKQLTWYWDTHPAVMKQRVTDGLAWSPMPADYVPFAPEEVVLFGGRHNAQLVEDFREELSKLTHDVYILWLSSYWQWLRHFLRQLLRGRTANKKAFFIDLDAERRAGLFFWCWIWDSVALFRWRIAHSPHGTLSRLRARLFHRVNWGRHEETEKGFRVPEVDHAQQLVRWCGFNVSPPGYQS